MRMTILYSLQGVSAELLDQIVSRLVKWDFFDKGLFDSANVLTSQGIQRRYFEIAKHRLRDDSLPYMLISPKGNYAKKGVSQQLTPVSQQLTPQIKEKKTKLNKTSPDGDVKETADKPAATATATTGDFEKNIPSGLPPDIESYLHRLLLIAPTLASSNGFTVTEIATTATRVARDWSLTGEYSRKDPVSHMRNTVLKILRTRPSPPSPAAIGTISSNSDGYARQRDAERQEIDRAYSLDSAAELRAYLESRGLAPDTSLTDTVKPLGTTPDKRHKP